MDEPNNEIQIAETVIVPSIGSVREEMAQIDREFAISRIAYEIAMFRIYRINKMELWRDGFNSFEDFVNTMVEEYGAARQTN